MQRRSEGAGGLLMRQWLTPLLRLIIALLCSAHFLRGYNPEDFAKDFPTPFTSHNRVMGFILTFDFQHIDPLIDIVNEYVSMCEGGWDPTMVIISATAWSDAMKRYMALKGHCYRVNRPVRLIVEKHSKKVGTGLAAFHRSALGRYLYDADFFIYHEDDIIFKFSHLAGFLAETRRLRELMPSRGLVEYTIGFQRYRRLRREGDMHSTAMYRESDIFEQELMEEMPTFSPVCIRNAPYLQVGGNIHQGMWAFTQQQVLMLQEKCSFLNHSSPSREFMSSFSIFDHKPHHCAMTKVIPAEHLSAFMIYHYYQQRHVSWTPVFSSVENMLAGYHYYAIPKVKMDVPPCWQELVQRHHTEQYPEEELGTVVTTGTAGDSSSSSNGAVEAMSAVANTAAAVATAGAAAAGDTVPVLDIRRH